MSNTHRLFGVACVFCVITAFMWSCDGNSGVQTETICDDRQDNDRDQMMDCDDSDCRMDPACTGGDGDADTDTDVDSDSDTDTDSDSDVNLCDNVCDDPLFNRCEWGDCSESSPGTIVECCVSANTVCSTMFSVGSIYDDHEVSFRGFYDDNYKCTIRRFESAGRERFSFVIEARGLACEDGFVRVQAIAYVDDVVLGQEYALCGNDSPVSLAVSVTVTDSDDVQTAYSNQNCGLNGTFILNELGSESGQDYSMYFTGQLGGREGSSVDGQTINIEVDTQGLVKVEVDEM